MGGRRKKKRRRKEEKRREKEREKREKIEFETTSSPLERLGTRDEGFDTRY